VECRLHTANSRNFSKSILVWEMKLKVVHVSTHIGSQVYNSPYGVAANGLNQQMLSLANL